MSNENCESGCSCYTGGEIRHQRTCVNYPDSLTEMHDLANEKIAFLEGTISRLNKEADDNQVKIKSLNTEIVQKDKRVSGLVENINELEKNASVQDDRINNIKDRLEKTHNAYSNEIEKNDRLCEEIDKLRAVIKRRNEVIRLLSKDLE